MAIRYLVTTATRENVADFESEADALAFAMLKSRTDAGAWTWRVVEVEKVRDTVACYIGGKQTE